MFDWTSLILLTLTLLLIGGQYLRSGRQGFWKYGLIWIAIIAIVAILYNVLAPRFMGQEDATKTLPLIDTSEKKEI